ncbi:MAG: hypothetical protein K2X93_27835 [Candidatus Obscuribacterales bacterium]|nr:hypothetical protein [Candidatus Obscuribacterales bacterium]
MIGKFLSFVRPASSIALVTGALLLSCTPAFANHRDGGFRQFREINPDLSRRQARQFFQGRTPRGDALSRGRTILPPSSLSSVSTLALPGPKSEHPSGAQQLRSDLRRQQRTFQFTEAGQRVGMRAGVDLDLSSSEANIVLGAKLMSSQGPVTIESGGVTKTYSAGSQVTAAEYVAVKQVISGGKQEVILDGQGRAVGGQFDLQQITSRSDQIRADDFIVPENVVGYGDFGRRSSFQVDGDLVNAGSLLARSSANAGRAGFDLSAGSITNQTGGTIASGPSIYTFSENDTTVDLNLRARDGITNQGTIASTGDLTLTAGDTITNSGSIAASGSVKISAPNVVNSSLIESMSSDVTLDSESPSMLLVDNRNGTIAARNGAINLRDSSYRDAYDTRMYGGDALSREFNVNAGHGTADIDINQLTGTLSQTGLASHVSSLTENLVLGNICLTGDPTYKNVGNITLSGDIAVGEALTIIASGNITNTGALSITAGNATTGFPITIIAGANITSGGANSPTLPPLGAGVTTAINGASGTGGSVDLENNFPVLISSRSTSLVGNKNGGNVLIAAFSASGAGGSISLGSDTTVLSGGLGNGNNGDVKLIAELIVVGTIDATGSSVAVATGDVNAIAAQPNSGSVSWNANGTLASGAVTPGSFANSAGVIFEGSVTAGGAITVQGGRIDTIGNLILTTTDPNSGTIDLTSSDPTPSFTGIDIGQISTVTLNATSAEEINIDAANAQFINLTAVGSVDLDSVNPGLTVFGVSSTDVTANFLGSVTSEPSTGINAVSGIANISSATGNIGLSAGSPLRFDSGTVQFRAPEGNVFAESIAASPTLLRGGDHLAAGTYSVKINDDLAGLASTNVVAQNIILQSTGFNLIGAYTGTNSISLTSDNGITTATVPGTLTTPRLRLESTFGSIGVDAGNRFNVGAAVGSVEAVSIASVFLAAPVVKGFSLAGGFAANVFDYLGQGSTTITGDVTTVTNNLSLATATGSLTVDPEVTISSGRDLSILLTAPTAQASKSKVVIGKNVELISRTFGVNGDILISVGSVGAPVVGVAPKNVVSVEFPGVDIFFGQFGFKTKAPTNTLFAQGADININNPVSLKAISLGGGVTIVTQP